uniref:ZP domain-containing protein n=1 Tax=Clytia hemisphaerica TaxID=252671 RepID=A0A7M5WSR2_9CNID
MNSFILVVLMTICVHCSISLKFTAQGCFKDSMLLEISAEKLGIENREFQMHFNGYFDDQKCSIESGSNINDFDYYFLANFYKDCGIQESVMDTKTVYNQTVCITFDRDLKSQIAFDFECVLKKRL